MYRRILVGYLDTAPGHDALALGTALAVATGAELALGTAPDPQDRDLPALARAYDADLMVLGSTHYGGLGRLVPGATVEHLLGEAPCAVAVAPPGFAERPTADGWQPLRGGAEDAGMRVIGVGYDGSPAAMRALETAAELATYNGAGMRVYAVAPKTPQVPGAEPQAQTANHRAPSQAVALRESLHQAVAKLPSEARALPVFSRGFPAEELIRATQTGVDLLVLGSRRGGPIRRVLHNSVSSTVINRAACPVLILPSGVPAAQPAMA
ncbi:MAG TPA: universal stress protein [Solirubrobacterales bacterium]